MAKHYHTICLIPAGGTGSRAKLEYPKQYAPLNNKPLIRHTVEAFLDHTAIDAVCVIRSEDHHQLYLEALGDLPLIDPANGGRTRQESIKNGLIAIEKYTPKKVLIHDAARPFVTDELITNTVEALTKHDAVIPVIELEDTIKRCEGSFVIETLDRSTLYRAQTPQGFNYPTILNAHTQNQQEVTDDAALFEALNLPVHTIDGHKDNYKITTETDMTHAQKMLTQMPTIRTGFGFDVHRFNEEKATSIRIGGVDIPYHRSLKGHSDADVLLHALVDAMLGAVGAGDIGEHFPPSNPEFKGADSALFVQKANLLLQEQNTSICNVDLLLIGEAPKLTPHKAAIKKRIAQLLDLCENLVNVKATTTEKLGFTGREEGLAAQATVTVRS